jgi:hypothetical protein
VSYDGNGSGDAEFVVTDLRLLRCGHALDPDVPGGRVRGELPRHRGTPEKHREERRHIATTSPTMLPTDGNVRWMSPADPEEGIRAICMSLPGVTERLSHGAPAFFAGRQFLTLWLDGHHDHRFPHMWCAAPTGVQDELVTTEPDRFFRPPYVGGRGWIGVRLDGDIDWEEIMVVCEEAFRTVAPKKLRETLDLSRLK